jgi:hypothetical protein
MPTPKPKPKIIIKPQVKRDVLNNSDFTNYVSKF